MSDSPRRGLWRELVANAREQRTERHFAALGRERSCVEPRQVDQLRELDFERIRRRFDVRDEWPPFGIACARGKRRDVQAERVQRLAQVVARRGKELALRAVRGLGGLFGAEQLLGLRAARRLDAVALDGDGGRADQHLHH